MFSVKPVSAPAWLLVVPATKAGAKGLFVLPGTAPPGPEVNWNCSSDSEPEPPTWRYPTTHANEARVV